MIRVNILRKTTLAILEEQNNQENETTCQPSKYNQFKCNVSKNIVF